MGANAIGLPSGFVLDQQPKAAAPGLPEGFVLDAPARPSMAGDIAKGAVGGLARGAIGLAGLPGDASALVHSMLPQPPPQQPEPEGAYGKIVGFLNKARSALEPPTSGQIQSGVEGITGPLPQAQTVPGQYAETIGEFAPAALGPGGIARRLAQSVVPGVASETAGQITQGTPAEPYARAGAAILGGAAGAKAAEGRAARAVANAAPTNADIKAGAGNTYDALTARNIGVPVSNTELKDTAQEIRDTLNRKGLRPSNASGVHAALNELEKPATPNLGDVADLVAARQNLKSFLGAQDSNKGAAAIALPILEKKIERWSPGTMKQLREADQDYSIFKAGEAVDKKLARAELRNAGDHSGMNLGNKIRQQVTNYLVSDQSRFLSPENRKSLEGVVHASPTENLMRFGSNLLGGGGGLGSTLLGLAGVGAGAATGHPEAAMLPMLGLGLRGATNRAIASRAARAQAEMRGRSNLAQARGMPIMPPRLNASQAALLNAALSMPMLGLPVRR